MSLSIDTDHEQSCCMMSLCYMIVTETKASWHSNHCLKLNNRNCNINTITTDNYGIMYWLYNTIGLWKTVLMAPIRYESYPIFLRKLRANLNCLLPRVKHEKRNNPILICPSASSTNYFLHNTQIEMYPSEQKENPPQITQSDHKVWETIKDHTQNKLPFPLANSAWHVIYGDH